MKNFWKQYELNWKFISIILVGVVVIFASMAAMNSKQKNDCKADTQTLILEKQSISNALTNKEENDQRTLLTCELEVKRLNDYIETLK